MKQMLFAMILVGMCFAQAPTGVRARQVAGGPGRITGTVLNEEGSLIAGALVCLSAATEPNRSECSWFTDQAGHFEIPQLPLVSFRVSASKEDDGYSALNNVLSQEAALTQQEPTANVTIKLAAKAGTLIGSVRDSLTGKPVDKIRVLWIAATDERAGTGAAYGYMGGAFRVNLPTTSDFIVFVTAPGYKPWFYNDAANGPALRLVSGEQKTLDVTLERAPEPKGNK